MEYSLSLSLKLYNDKKIYSFFHLMGYLPGGAREEDIEQFWKKVNKSTLIEWKPYCNYLQKACIITKKNVKLNKETVEVYQLVPMLKNIAEEYGNKEEKSSLHKIVTKYYIQILEEILEKNSVSKNSQENEALMNNLWFFETNIWDCIYRALEIKKKIPIQRIETNISNESRSPSPMKAGHKQMDSSKLDLSLFKSGPSPPNDDDNESLSDVSRLDTNALLHTETDQIEEEKQPPAQGRRNNRRMTNNDLLNLVNLNRLKEQQEQEEENALSDILQKVRPQIMPRTKSDDLEDSNVLSFIQKSVMPENDKESKLVKPKPKIKKKKIDSGVGNESSFLIREMDKRLKRTINDKVANMIKKDQRLSQLSMPKEELYVKLAHKFEEMQEQHKLYKGETTNMVYKKGKTMKEISHDSKILILYLSNLILFSKKTDAVKAIDEYGKYFYDKDLCEANLCKLKALALIRNKKDINFENATEAIKEFLRAKVIYTKHDCHHGIGICCAGVGFILYEIFIHYVKNRIALLKYAKRTFVESLFHYEAIQHKYAMSF